MMNEGSPATVVKLALLDRTLEFQGESVATVSTEVAGSQRWTELMLYRVTDGTGRYVLHVLGRSIVFHRHGSSCNAGTPCRVADLDDNAYPCEECWPPETDVELADAEVVDRETDRPNAYVCETVNEVVGHLRSRHAPGRFTTPGLRLLEKVVKVDPVFASAMSAVERL